MKWIEFQSGPPYFEAIASNRLDFGEVGILQSFQRKQQVLDLPKSPIQVMREKELEFSFKKIARLRV